MEMRVQAFFTLLMIVFIDDIFMYLRSRAYVAFEIMLQILRDYRLFAKFSKFEFWLELGTLLGYVVSNDGIMVDPTKIKAICD